MKRGAWLLIAVLVVAGCVPANEKPVAVRSSPPPTPPARVGAVADSPEFSFTDKNGKRVAQISAQSGAVTGASGTDALGELRKGRATLYQKGKPVATLTADTLKADQKTRVVTGIGNVSLRAVNTSTEERADLRADRMVWEYDANRVTGTGNVVLSRGATVRIPGVQIVADTALQSVEMSGDGTPITGTIP